MKTNMNELETFTASYGVASTAEIEKRMSALLQMEHPAEEISERNMHLNIIKRLEDEVASLKADKKKVRSDDRRAYEKINKAIDGKNAEIHNHKANIADISAKKNHNENLLWERNQKITALEDERRHIEVLIDEAKKNGDFSNYKKLEEELFRNRSEFKTLKNTPVELIDTTSDVELEAQELQRMIRRRLWAELAYYAQKMREAYTAAYNSDVRISEKLDAYKWTMEKSVYSNVAFTRAYYNGGLTAGVPVQAQIPDPVCLIQNMKNS